MVERVEEVPLKGAGLTKRTLCSCDRLTDQISPSIAFESTTFIKILFVAYLIRDWAAWKKFRLDGLDETQIKFSIGFLFRLVGDLTLDFISIVPLFSGALGLLGVVSLTTLVALWFLVFWCFGAPSVPFTHVYFVDTHIFVSTYALCVLYARVWLRQSRLLSLLIAFDLTYWKRLIFFYQYWWSQYTFTIFWLPRVLFWSSIY